MVEDSVDDTLLIAAELQRGGLDPVFERVETAASLQAALDAHNWDPIICDYSMPHLAGPAALAIYQQKGLDIPSISISGTVGEETVAEMMKAGAHDYVMKSNLARLVPAVKRELRGAQERRDRRQTEAVSAYLASIVESYDDAIIGKTLDGTVASWNLGAERIYGYSAAEDDRAFDFRPDPVLPAGRASGDFRYHQAGRRGGWVGNGAHPERRNARGSFAHHLAD